MNEQKSRLRVFDVKKENNVNVKTQIQRRNPRNHPREKDLPQDAYEQWPIEASFVKAAIIEYGKRTASLNALHCAQTLDYIVDKIRDSTNPTQEMFDIATYAENEALKLRQQAKKVYEK
jgi:hypothetical protein